MSTQVATHQATAAQNPPVVIDWPSIPEHSAWEAGLQPLSFLVPPAFSYHDTATGSSGRNARRVQPQPRRRWSETCVNVLRAVYPTSLPVIDIAARLDRSRGSIYGKARRLGLRRPPRENKRSEPILAEYKLAAAGDIPILAALTDKPIAVVDAIVVANEEQKPEPTPLSATRYQPEEIPTLLALTDKPILETDVIVVPHTEQKPEHTQLSDPRIQPEEVPTLPELSDKPIAVSDTIIVPDKERYPEPPPPSAPIIQKASEAPRSYVRTKLAGRLTVWFPDLVERMMRLWLANVHHTVIAHVLGPEITGGAVQRKAHRVGMLPRHGLSLILDIEVAREIDRQAAPLPRVIRDHRGKPWHLRICGGAEVACYRPNTSRLSPQAMETKWYQEGASVMI